MKIKKENTASGQWNYTVKGIVYMVYSHDTSTQAVQGIRVWNWVNLANPTNDIGDDYFKTRTEAANDLIAKKCK